MIGMGFLAVMITACVLTLPWTLGAGDDGAPRYNSGTPREARLSPWWAPKDRNELLRLNALVPAGDVEAIAAEQGVSVDDVRAATSGPIARDMRVFHPKPWLGTDMLGRSLLVRALTGGGISLGVGLAAALISVTIGTLWGTLAAYAGGKTDAFMMRIVDVLYGLPYILLVVLLAVASEAVVDEYINRTKAREAWMINQVRELAPEGVDARRGAVLSYLERPAQAELASRLRAESVATVPERNVSAGARTLLDVMTLVLAIGGVSWLTMARVVRGQVLSLKGQPFVEAARAIGAKPTRIFRKHLLPNLMGPIIVYATLTVPQAILQESFLSFLGIGVKPPLPSWGNLAAEGLSEVNLYRSHWWLLFFPCLLLGVTLLALNFVGEGLREAFDPKRARK